LQVGTPLTEQLGVQWRYSIYNQAVTLDPTTLTAVPSLPIQQAALAGPAWVSAVGDTVSYNTLDNTKAPTSGLNSQLKQDLAGLGGDVNFLRTTEDLRFYHALTSDVVSIVHAQGGLITGWGGKQVPLIDTFFGGPQLVRGFAPNGFGPRDLTPGSTMDNVGGNMYWATSLELQSAIPGVPQEYGIKATSFVDAGSLWGYRGPTAFPGSTQTIATCQFQCGALVGRGRADLGFAVRRADRRLRGAADKGRVRCGAAVSVWRRAVLSEER